MVMEFKIPVELQTVKLTDIVDIVVDNGENGENQQKKTTGTGTEDSDSVKTITKADNKTMTVGEENHTNTTKLFLKSQLNGSQKLIYVRPKATVLKEKSADTETKEVAKEISTQVIARQDGQGLAISTVPTLQSTEKVKSTVTQTTKLTDKEGKTTKLFFSLQRNKRESEPENEPRNPILLPGKFCDSFSFFLSFSIIHSFILSFSIIYREPE